METEFLSPVDSKAAEALVAMIESGSVSNLSEPQRAAWTAFLNSLLVRMPDDIQKMRFIIEKTINMTMPFIDGMYQQVRAIGIQEKGLPETAAALLAERLPVMISKSSMERVREIISDPIITNGIADMEWRIRELVGLRNELLTSDRPIAISQVLNASESHLVLPVGPKTVFLAFRDKKIADHVSRVSDSQLATTLNRHLVQNAVSFVYGRTDGQLRFVQNRMGANREATWMDRMVELANANLGPMPDLAEIVDVDDFRRRIREAYAEGLVKRQMTSLTE
jgi:hypothetical protein